MPDPIRLFVDFASPYSYFALDPVARLAERYGRALEIHPFLVWAVLKHYGVANPIETPARRAYFLADVARSAAFHGVPFQVPEPLQVSAHLAARLFYAWTETRPEGGLALAREIFTTFFAQGLPVTDPAVLAGLPSLAGLSSEEVRALIDGPVGRRRLAEAVETAIAAGVVGAPFTVIDREGFFGADRVPQIAWRLDGGRGASPEVGESP